jgi:K+-sensing histidine kinase KdpD
VEALPFDRARDLREVLDVAVELGARTVQLAAGETVDAVESAVHDLGGTHLFVPHAPGGRLDALRRRPLADRLAERLPDVDVHLVGRD